MADGWLLINLGSPEKPTIRHVRRYLREFLMDRHVIDLHWGLRAPLVHGLIAPTRAPKSARAYQAIWTEQGSPLIHHSLELLSKMENRLAPEPVELAMRYGRPSVEGALARLKKTGVDRVNVIPLYPQFAKSSTWTAVEAVARAKRRLRARFRLRFLHDFFDQPEWIEALSENIRRENQGFEADHLLLSYHGLPEHHIRQLDPSNSHCLVHANCCNTVSKETRSCYRSQCFATSRALVDRLGWPSGRFEVSFQSRLGRRPWIKPYSDHVVVELAKGGKKRLLVTCPSFVADCLETLEEVAIRLRHDFVQAGGEDLRLVPAVNASDEWARLFTQMLRRPNLSWFEEGEAGRPLFSI